jgi:hypothetical protein
VISILNYFLYVLQTNFIDFAIVKQFFEHTFSFIGTSTKRPLFLSLSLHAIISAPPNLSLLSTIRQTRSCSTSSS